MLRAVLVPLVHLAKASPERHGILFLGNFNHLALRDGEHVLVADDPAAFARAIVRRAEERALWERLAAAGREAVVATHGRAFVDEQCRARVARLVRRDSDPSPNRRLHTPG
jgi:hypothetical protein